MNDVSIQKLKVLTVRKELRQIEKLFLICYLTTKHEMSVFYSLV